MPRVRIWTDLLSSGFQKVIFFEGLPVAWLHLNIETLGCTFVSSAQTAKLIHCPVQKYREGKHSVVCKAFWRCWIDLSACLCGLSLPTEGSKPGNSWEHVSVTWPAPAGIWAAPWGRGGLVVFAFVTQGDTQSVLLSSLPPSLSLSLNVVWFVCVEWPTIPVCRELSRFPEHGTFGAKPRKFLDKPGQVGHPTCVINGMFLSNRFNHICAFFS